MSAPPKTPGVVARSLNAAQPPPPRRPAQLILRTALVTFEFKAASPAPAGGLGLEAGMQFRFVQLFAPSRAR